MIEANKTAAEGIEQLNVTEGIGQPDAQGYENDRNDQDQHRCGIEIRFRAHYEAFANDAHFWLCFALVMTCAHCCAISGAVSWPSSRLWLVRGTIELAKSAQTRRSTGITIGTTLGSVSSSNQALNLVSAYSGSFTAAV